MQNESNMNLLNQAGEKPLQTAWTAENLMSFLKLLTGADLEGPNSE